MRWFTAMGLMAAAVAVAAWMPTIGGAEEKPAEKEAGQAPGKEVAAPGKVVQASAEEPVKEPAKGDSKVKRADAKLPPPKPLAEFVENGLDWLIKAQHESGGWGAGSHAAQQIRDPHKVKVDPATTAFTGLTFLRAGHTPTEGTHSQAVRKATEYLVEVVEKAPSEGPKITDITGTQIQTKLGPLVDTTFTTQYLSRVLTLLPENDPLHERVDKALDVCIAKLQLAQKKDGSWNVGGGWAPVLQSSSGTQALELARAAGKKIDGQKLANARKYQKGNFNTKTGKADAKAGAGVELYAFSGSQRANANEARAADAIVSKAKKEGKLAADAEVSEESLRQAGVAQPQAEQLASAAAQNSAQIARLGDERLLKGFGNNGGEEFVSFLLTSESMIIAGGDDWAKWNDKMHGLMAKIQNPDGSWNGHHCITSPVFCTSAVVQVLTADRDAEILIATAEKEAEEIMK